MADPEDPEATTTPATVGGVVVNESDKKEGDEAAKEGEVGIAVGGAKFTVSEIQMPFFGMFFAGMVVIIAINADNGKYAKNYWEYGNALGAVTMFFSLAGAIMTKKNEGMVQKAGKMNAYFLFLWCFIGACFMTFGKGPFTRTGNGYFGSWAMAIFSIQAAGVSGDAMKKNISGMSSMIGLMASSIIVLIATASDVDKANSYRNEAIYGLALSIVSIIVVGLFLFMERREDAEKSKLKFPIMIVFAMMWIIFACLATFRGPFKDTGNGYFASWGGAITSLFAALGARD